MVDEQPDDFTPDMDAGNNRPSGDDDVVVHVYFARAAAEAQVSAPTAVDEAEEPTAEHPPVAPAVEPGEPPAEEVELPAYDLPTAERPTLRNLPSPEDFETAEDELGAPAAAPETESAPPPDKESRSPFRLWLTVLIIILLIGVAGVAVVAADAVPERVVALLPFVEGIGDDAGAAEAEVAEDAGEDEPEQVVGIIEPTVEPTERGDEVAGTLAAANAPVVPTEQPAEEPAETAEPAVPEPTEEAETPAEATSTPAVEVSEGPAETITQQGAEMLLVPGGTFEMGGGPAEPAHEVTLDAFYVDRYEVTNAEWAECVQAGACLPPSSTTDFLGNEYYGDEAFADYPVVNVDWQNADAYCRWRGSDLPTEAQWEMAARWDPQSEAVTVYPWADEWQPTLLNFCDESCALGGEDVDVDDGYPQTAPVDAFPEGASAVGALNMAGNVAEWVADWYDPDYYEVAPAENPAGPAEPTENRVVRGGAWGVSEPRFFDARFRSSFDPELEGLGIGLRCAALVSEVEQ